MAFISGKVSMSKENREMEIGIEIERCRNEVEMAKKKTSIEY